MGYDRELEGLYELLYEENSVCVCVCVCVCEREREREREREYCGVYLLCHSQLVVVCAALLYMGIVLCKTNS
jgi:hypothetical protein